MADGRYINFYVKIAISPQRFKQS